MSRQFKAVITDFIDDILEPEKRILGDLAQIVALNAHHEDELVDVMVHEPPLPFDPLIAAWRNPSHPAHHRVLINPHSAFYSEEGLLDMRTKGASACRLALLGRPIPTVVNGHHIAQKTLTGNHRRPAIFASSR